MRIKIAIPLNLLLAALVLWSWLTMFTGYDTGTMLTAARLRSLKYFTLDSNLLAAATALIAVYYELFRGGTLPVWVRSLKLAGAASVAVTFLPVIIQGVLWSLTLSVGKSLSETLGMAQAAKLLDALGAVFSAVISVALCVSAIYIISTAVVLMSGGGAS